MIIATFIPTTPYAFDPASGIVDTSPLAFRVPSIEPVQHVGDTTPAERSRTWL